MRDKYALDSLGILPYRYETEERYLERGNRLIDEYSENVEYVKAFNRDGKIEGLVEKERVTESVVHIFSRYDMNLEWIDVNYWKGERGCLGLALRGEKYAGKYLPPLALISRKAKDHVIVHELLHCARFPVFPIGRSEKHSNFEEAMASLHFSALQRFLLGRSIRKEMKKIRSAKKTLEDRIGRDSGSVVMRLTLWEVYFLAERGFSQFYIHMGSQAGKPAKGLRLSIIIDKYFS